MYKFACSCARAFIRLRQCEYALFFPLSFRFSPVTSLSMNRYIEAPAYELETSIPTFLSSSLSTNM